MPSLFQEKYLKFPGPLRLKAQELNTVAHREINTSLCWTSLVAQMVKRLPSMWETWVQSPGWEDPLEKGMAIHSSNILAWRILWTEEPGRLQYKRLQRIEHD